MFDFITKHFKEEERTPSDPLKYEWTKQQKYIRELERMIMKGGKQNMPRELQRPSLEDQEDVSGFDEEETGEVLEEEEAPRQMPKRLPNGQFVPKKPIAKKQEAVAIREVTIDLQLLNNKLNYLIEQLETIKGKL